MNGPSNDKDAAARIARRRAADRAWREANPDKVKAQQQRDRPAIERYNAANRDKILQQKRVAERKRRERVKAEEETRERARERSRQWKSNHQEQRRDYERQYRDQHRERLRGQGRAYYDRHKEEIAIRRAARARTDPGFRDGARRYREANPEKVREQKRAYQAKPGVYEQSLEYNKQWRRRERARLKAGLPRVPGHRALKAERQVNIAAADAFFTRPRKAEETMSIGLELQRLREEKASREKIAQRRKAEHAMIARINSAIIDAYLQRRGKRLRDEVQLDSRARQIRGASPYPDLEAETRRRAAELIAKAKADRPRKPCGPAPSRKSAASPSRNPNTGPITDPGASTTTPGRGL